MSLRCLLRFSAVLLTQALGSLSARAEDAPAPAQQNLSLDDLLNLKVSIASKTETTVREQPGIVTVITAEEIKNVGARDIRDVFNTLVPGFNLISDVEIGSTVSVRGLQTSEGKMLVMINGLEMNETKYGSMQYASHFPVDYIDRIEIIRGPGSAVYGGYAALGVINIITKNSNMHGGYANIMGDVAAPGGWLEQKGAIGAGGESGKLKWYINTVDSRSTLTLDKDYVSYEGYHEDLAHVREGIHLSHMDAGVDYGDTKLKVLAERFQQPYLYFSDPSFDWSSNYDWHDLYIADLSHDFHLTPTMSLTPEVNVKYQAAYYNDHGPTTYWSRNKNQKNTGDLYWKWDFSKKTNILVGVETYTNFVRMPENPTPDEAVYGGGTGHVSYHDTAVFAQLMNFNDIVNTTLGVRYDKTDIFGDNTAPRIGLTKVIGNFHAKYQLAESFKVPGGIIYALEAPGQTLKPEKATNNEIELGYKFTPKLFLVTNFYDIVIRDLQVYQTNATNAEGTYVNGGKIGTRGGEAQLRYVSDLYDMNVNVSYYKLMVNDEPIYGVPNHPDSTLGSPNLRAGFVAGVKLPHDYSVHVSGYARGRRYGVVSQGPQTGTDENGNPLYADHEVQAFAPDVIVNLVLRDRRAFGVNGLELDLTGQNLTNQEQEMIQYQDNLLAPLPGLPRSVTLAANYSW